MGFGLTLEERYEELRAELNDAKAQFEYEYAQQRRLRDDVAKARAEGYERGFADAREMAAIMVQPKPFHDYAVLSEIRTRIEAMQPAPDAAKKEG